MTSIDLVVVLLGAALIARLAWFFFRPRQAARARVDGGVQTVDVRVKGGYAPNLIRATAGMPLRLRFDRQESSDCTAPVVFPDFRMSTSLLPFRTTTVEFTPTEPGQYGFACGMNMLHGTLIVDPAHAADAPDGKDRQAREERARDHAVEDTEATARAVGVGPRVNPHPGCERVQFALPGWSRTLPANAAKVEAQLRAIGGVDSTEVNVGGVSGSCSPTTRGSSMVTG
jgi:Cu+-exporting ATPase